MSSVSVCSSASCPQLLSVGLRVARPRGASCALFQSVQVPHVLSFCLRVASPSPACGPLPSLAVRVATVRAHFPCLTKYGTDKALYQTLKRALQKRNVCFGKNVRGVLISSVTPCTLSADEPEAERTT